MLDKFNETTHLKAIMYPYSHTVFSAWATFNPSFLFFEIQDFKDDIALLQALGATVKLGYGGEEWGNPDYDLRVCYRASKHLCGKKGGKMSTQI